MTTDNIEFLPIWKQGATAEERLLELAMVARKHPEKFNKFIIIYQENNEKNNSTSERFVNFNANTTECLGLLRLGEMSIIRNVT